jgi:sigma-B regulation protein RsbU (phosphoserine phosphatase)
MVASLKVEVKGEPPFEVILDRDLIGVGRAEDNALGLRDMNVSRHHFAIERRADGVYLIHDRGSRNGTVVNGSAVLDRVLQNGDRITVGNSVLTFTAVPTKAAITLDKAPRPRPGPLPVQNASTDPPPAPPARAPDHAQVEAQLGPSNRFTQRQSPTPPHSIARPLTPLPGSIDAPPDWPPTAPPLRAATPPMGVPLAPAVVLPAPISETPRHRWRKLAEAAAAINKERDLGKLLERIVDYVLALVPAKGAFLILREGEGLRVAFARHEDQSQGLRFSRTVCQEAIETKRPILTRDAVEDQELNEVVSIVELNLRAILCVPFSSNDEVLGVVYLDEPATELSGPAADDVIDLVAAFGDLAGIAFANARFLEGVREHQRLHEELRIASRIQRKLLPAAPPQVPGLDLGGSTLPAVEVGGDLYDFFQLGNDLFVSIGDVSGKGVGAGIVMSTVRALLRAYSEREAATDKLLIAMNRALARDLEHGTFVSFLLLRFDLRTGQVRYAGAGHEHMIVRRASGAVETLRTGGVVLGLMADLSGKIEERTLELRRGDLLVLYTDGATEAISPAGEELGLDRLVDAIKDSGPLAAPAVVDRVVAAVRDFQGAGNEPTDDLTVVAIRRR